MTWNLVTTRILDISLHPQNVTRKADLSRCDDKPQLGRLFVSRAPTT
jgi:hypothetical protein